MNATQNGPFTAILDDPKASLQLARRLMADGYLDEAEALFRHQRRVLAIGSAGWSDHTVGLAATICLAAQRTGARPSALHRLDEAQRLIDHALRAWPPEQGGVSLATARANLAAILLSRHVISGDSRDIMAAHMALDGSEATFSEHQDQEGLDWVRALRDQLVELRDRRALPR
jgi:hypothetical protein